MANPTLRAQLVPKGVAGDIGALRTAVDAVAGTDSVLVDPGLDLVASIDLVVSTAATPAAAQTILTNVLAAVTGVEVFSQSTEIDPVLSAPADPAVLDVSTPNTVDIVWTVTLGPGAHLVSAVLSGTVGSATIVPHSIVSGNPQGHDSQKSAQNRIVARIGPTTVAVATPRTLILTVTDSNGRTAADTVSVTLQA